jgi:hypothetical protein
MGPFVPHRLYNVWIPLTQTLKSYSSQDIPPITRVQFISDDLTNQIWRAADKGLRSASYSNFEI